MPKAWLHYPILSWHYTHSLQYQYVTTLTSLGSIHGWVVGSSEKQLSDPTRCLWADLWLWSTKHALTASKPVMKPSPQDCLKLEAWSVHEFLKCLKHVAASSLSCLLLAEEFTTGIPNICTSTFFFFLFVLYHLLVLLLHFKGLECQKSGSRILFIRLAQRVASCLSKCQFPTKMHQQISTESGRLANTEVKNHTFLLFSQPDQLHPCLWAQIGIHDEHGMLTLNSEPGFTHIIQTSHECKPDTSVHFLHSVTHLQEWPTSLGNPGILRWCNNPLPPWEVNSCKL